MLPPRPHQISVGSRRGLGPWVGFREGTIVLDPKTVGSGTLVGVMPCSFQRFEITVAESLARTFLEGQQIPTSLLCIIVFVPSIHELASAIRPVDRVWWPS